MSHSRPKKEKSAQAQWQRAQGKLCQARFFECMKQPIYRAEQWYLPEELVNPEPACKMAFDDCIKDAYRRPK